MHVCELTLWNRTVGKHLGFLNVRKEIDLICKKYYMQKSYMQKKTAWKIEAGGLDGDNLH